MLNTIILIASIIGIVNSFILVIYALTSKKGSRNSNIIFAFFILMLTLRISKSIFITFSENLHDILLTLGLSGFMAIGPAYYFLIESFSLPKFKFKWSQLIHLAPAIIFTFLWVFLDQIRGDYLIWKIFYRAILLQYIIYMLLSIRNTNQLFSNTPVIRKQLNIISVFLLAIWLTYVLNDAAQLPYISGAVLYSILIYFSLIIVINKGYIIESSAPKYEKTGLHGDEKARIESELNTLLQKKIYTDNTISLAKLSKQISCSTHALSQVINESKQQSFFELISAHRIAEAKKLLTSGNSKIVDIAYEVGYNSISAFNAAFKKECGLTPSNYRNER